MGVTEFKHAGRRRWAGLRSGAAIVVVHKISDPPRLRSWLVSERPAGAAVVTRISVSELTTFTETYLDRAAAGEVFEVAYAGTALSPAGLAGKVLGYLSTLRRPSMRISACCPPSW